MKAINIFLVLLTIIGTSCSGLKKKPQQEYNMMENLTSRYNIVYHADKIVAETEESLRQTHQNDYNQYLTVFIEPVTAGQSNATYLMDSVIGKANRIIDEKSQSRYVSHAYLLLGQANYLKGNFYNSAEFFGYLAHHYHDDPEYRQKGRIMQARSLMQLDRMTEAADVLDSVFAYLETHKKTQGAAFAAQADYYLNTGDLKNAASMLESAVAQGGNRKDKSRWRYLLAQLYTELDQPEQAHYWFRKTANSSDYEMAFQANLNRIGLEATVNQDPEKTIRSLKKLLRDAKNQDFRDQIQFMIGKTYADLGDLEHAKSHYEKTVREPTANRFQTAKTYTSLGDLYFDSKNFHNASLYYDSAALFVPTDLISTNLVSFQKRLLNYQQLAKGRALIQHQDSLLYLASLTEADRQIEVDRKIQTAYEQLVQEHKRQSRSRETEFTSLQLSPFAQASSQNFNDSGSDNRFYFNNPDAMGLGVAAFRRKWGNRNLQDNWRFSNTTASEMGTGDLLSDAGESSGSETVPVSDGLPEVAAFAQDYWETLLSELPLDEEKRNELYLSNQKELELIGNVYRSNLNEHGQAILTYQELLERYPKSSEKARWYYQLYQLFELTGDAQSDLYKDKILGEFPESVFAAVIQDPDFFRSSTAQKKELNTSFSDVFALFESRDYHGVQSAVDQLVIQLTPVQIQENESIVAQLAYLRALAMGYREPASSFVEHLKGITEKFPDEKLITPLVAQQIAYIQEFPEEFESREVALLNTDSLDRAFRSEVALTPWPQLILKSRQVAEQRPAPRTPLDISTRTTNVSSQSADSKNIGGNTGQLQQRNIITTTHLADRTDDSPIDRDLEILPQEATYYFVINVMHGSVNLAPSRFGIGQFNRSRYAQARITHQLKNVNKENQLIFVGPFTNYDDVKNYELQILPLLKDIMKIPADAYNSFLATDTTLNSFTDGDSVFSYHELYSRQR